MHGEDSSTSISGRTDEELMSLYQAGDYTAFEVLYRRHAGRVYEYLRKKVSSPDVAADLAQETFEKLHKSRSSYSAQYPFLPWLFTISRNTLVDHFKRAETRLTVPTPDIETHFANEGLASESLDIAPALATLPVNQRQAIEFRYLRDWSFKQIADHMDTSEDNARKLISRGMQKVREFFGTGGRK